MRWSMKRILIGAIIISLLAVGSPITSAEGESNFTFIKIWETPENELLSFSGEVVSPDGLLFGINTYQNEEASHNFICVKDGKILWRSQDIFFARGCYCSIIFGQNVITVGSILTDGYDDGEF
jgi:hypothetical protein